MAPGMVVADPSAPMSTMSLLAYGPDHVIEKKGVTLDDVRAAIGAHPVVWIDVSGLGDAALIKDLGRLLGLHQLALEDVVNTHQRPKVEHYPEDASGRDRLFMVVREMSIAERVVNEQLSLFLGPNFVISFQEEAGDCFGPVRQRIRESHGRIRSRGCDYLCYALLDATVDSYFPIIEMLGEQLEELELNVLACPNDKDLAKLHEVKRDLFAVRRAAWPLREMLFSLVRDEYDLISGETRLFLRDCADHSVQILDLVETDRELCADLMDLYLSSVSHRLNNVMKVLTIISTIFIPLTFLAGVYGMNFRTEAGPWSMPELNWPFGYAAFWCVTVVIAGGLLLAFERLGWLGKRGHRG